MSAEVVKDPKVYRVPQGWRAVCPEHPEFKDWPHRTKTRAMHAARAHNEESHREPQA